MAEWYGAHQIGILAYCLMPNHVHLIRSAPCRRTPGGKQDGLNIWPSRAQVETAFPRLLSDRAGSPPAMELSGIAIGSTQVGRTPAGLERESCRGAGAGRFACFQLLASRPGCSVLPRC